MFLSTTESARLVLNNDSGMFTKRYIKSIGELVGDRSLLCAPQHHHKILRSRLINLFSKRSTALMVRHFDELVVDALGGWEHRGTVVLLTDLLQVCFTYFVVLGLFKAFSLSVHSLNGSWPSFLLIC